MDFLKFLFFTPERCTFSYSLTVTTLHETKILSGSKKKIIYDILLVKIGFSLKYSGGDIQDEKSNEDESYKYSHLYYAVYYSDSIFSKSQVTLTIKIIFKCRKIFFTQNSLLITTLTYQFKYYF